ncbi:hypothetical protein GCM10012275_53180 [Longimycelium tulufanense]|uniref:Uncharacterized protein n=1 Tax=Longimycelium tulufanense TaxID=907463 RepID=A0A8J3FXP5_9PSEU|nr:hypothetical protein [Longimycelium tulufanense]GGM75806.1 hypothetical protein GCM10012275_53180 [Longimycelium tulufanense]
MGLFSGSKKQHQADAARYAAAAKREAAEARKLKAEAEEVQKRNWSDLYPDFAATDAITRHLTTNRRVCEDNANDFRRMAAESERLSRKWF